MLRPWLFQCPYLGRCQPISSWERTAHYIGRRAPLRLGLELLLFVCHVAAFCFHPLPVRQLHIFFALFPIRPKLTLLVRVRLFQALVQLLALLDQPLPPRTLRRRLVPVGVPVLAVVLPVRVAVLRDAAHLYQGERVPTQPSMTA
jgi:hypothetical protein